MRTFDPMPLDNFWGIFGINTFYLLLYPNFRKLEGVFDHYPLTYPFTHPSNYPPTHPYKTSFLGFKKKNIYLEEFLKTQFLFPNYQ